MKIKVPTMADVTHIECDLPVHHGDEDITYDFPLRTGDLFCVRINIDTGRIEGWPEGKTGRAYLKVVDAGHYRLMDGNKVVAEFSDYVPACIPGEWGDYIDFGIDAQGHIANWRKVCTPENVHESFFNWEI